MLSQRLIFCVTTNIQTIFTRPIKTTSTLYAEPLKKKKKTDASIIQIRIERKRRKFERLVQQFEAQEKIKIPLVEYTIDKHILKNLNERKRKNVERLNEIKNELERLHVVWSLYKGLENHFDFNCTKLVLQTRLNALKQLFKISPKLYENSLLIDETLFPFEDKQFVKETVVNKNYTPNDGQVVDATKVWKIEI